MNQNTQGAKCMESSFAEKDMVVLEVKYEQSICPCGSNGILGCVRKRVLCRSREMTLLHYSVVVRPHLVCYVQFWALQYKRDMNILRKVFSKGLLK